MSTKWKTAGAGNLSRVIGPILKYCLRCMKDTHHDVRETDDSNNQSNKNLHVCQKCSAQS